jgi:hypothetical protein
MWASVLYFKPFSLVRRSPATTRIKTGLLENWLKLRLPSLRVVLLSLVPSHSILIIATVATDFLRYFLFGIQIPKFALFF